MTTGAGCAIIDSCPIRCPSSKNQRTGCSHDGLASVVNSCYYHYGLLSQLWVICNRYSLTMNCSTYQAFSDYSCADVISKTLANHNSQWQPRPSITCIQYYLQEGMKCLVTSQNVLCSRQLLALILLYDMVIAYDINVISSATPTSMH